MIQMPRRVGDTVREEKGETASQQEGFSAFWRRLSATVPADLKRKMISVPIDDRGCATGAGPGHWEGEKLNSIDLGILQRVAK